uniref:G_PROTEIN_RECEP_F1_2 domain-containing protein n=1 Tax=Caenorhabditis japonica TaxID=281687 RepID=A0A8R1DGL1_CAEJA
MVHINLTRLVHECELQMNERDVELVEKRHARLDKSTDSILVMAPIFSIISFFFALTLLAAIIYALLGRKIPSRKYSIIISRTVADIFTSALIAAASLFANTCSASYMLLALFLYICTFGVVHLTSSHCAVIVLRQISVTRPYGFQSICSIRRLSLVVGFTWILSIMYCAAYAPMITVIVNPSKGDRVCSYHTCQRPLIIAAIIIVALSMFTIISSYAIVMAKMAQIAKSEKLVII